MQKYFAFCLVICFAEIVVSKDLSEKLEDLARIKTKIAKYSFPVSDITDEDEQQLQKICENNNELKSCVLACNSTKADMARKKYRSQCGDFSDLNIISQIKKDKKERRDKNEKARKRRRRSSSSYVDPCTTGSHIQEVLTYVLNQDDEEVEIYHDTSNFVFRTFYIMECQDDTAYIPSGYECRRQHVLVKAAVFPSDSYDVTVDNIQLPATCALVKII